MTRQILVIDDEEDLRNLLQAVLEDKGGWSVSAVGSCVAGLEIVQTTWMDLIILDVSMPEIDGYQCFERLQAHSQTRSIPVVLLTAKVLPSDRRRFSRMNVMGVITKPFDPMSICDEIAQMTRWSH